MSNHVSTDGYFLDVYSVQLEDLICTTVFQQINKWKEPSVQKSKVFILIVIFKIVIIIIRCEIPL